MAITLAEASKLSNDILLQGVIETIIKESPVLQYLPFIEVVGNGLTYNQEKTLGTIEFYNVGDTWAESTPTFEQVTAVLRILGGDADVDGLLKATRSNLNDLEAEIIALKAKAAAHKFEQTFVYGDNGVNAKEWNGLILTIDTQTPSAQVIAMGADGATLSLVKIDELCDLVKGGRPDLLLMSRRSRRKIQSLCRAAGTNLEISTGKIGQQVELWGTVPIGVSDWVLDTHLVALSKEAAKNWTGGTSSTIYAIQFGEGALCGITSPGGLQVERVGPLENKDATRTRIKFYNSLVLFCSLKAAALIGVQD